MTKELIRRVEATGIREKRKERIKAWEYGKENRRKNGKSGKMERWRERVRKKQSEGERRVATPLRGVASIGQGGVCCRPTMIDGLIIRGYCGGVSRDSELMSALASASGCALEGKVIDGGQRIRIECPSYCDYLRYLGGRLGGERESWRHLWYTQLYIPYSSEWEFEC